MMNCYPVLKLEELVVPGMVESPLTWLYVQDVDTATQYRLDWEDVRSRWGWNLNGFPASLVLNPQELSESDNPMEVGQVGRYHLGSQHPQR